MGKHKSTPTQSKKAESYFSPCKKAKTTPGPTAQGGSSAQEASSGATVAVAPKKIWTKKDLPKKLDRFSIHYPKGVAGELFKALNKKKAAICKSNYIYVKQYSQTAKYQSLPARTHAKSIQLRSTLEMARCKYKRQSMVD
ncbi:unnamed protein product [Mucor fragilis]